MPKQKLIITISGDPGSGKSTIAQKLAGELKAQRIYVGQIRRQLAKKMKFSLAELNDYAKTHPETDIDVDQQAAKQARQIAKKSLVIVEGRTQFYFLPESFKIYVKVRSTEGARRIWLELQSPQAQKKRNEGHFTSFAAVKKSLQKRVANDKQRYKKYYKIDHTKKTHYDLVIDTTKITAQQAASKILSNVRNLTKST